ncbi:SNF2-related protein [Pontibacter akesuensis]|uniref:Superfamily II DNA or RNA helicase, SNF2 family n=1 Tax=Pontibacter akesuensis TaxID=388950 RepID=A0A1I7JXK9_9BACT|nr:SNF2-related protein [Pontibacter akesuensis]GHA76729.1 hypothetical protein GCM10007389_33400 [Pontibacter akesuensis]SFU89970.1 Superfamily II DNA or RNA helicase, SNF2 family [Pontibacter akesuensis]
MFSYSQDEAFSFFVLNEKGEKLPTITWQERQSDYLAQFSILNELVDNGFAIKINQTVQVEASQILQLTTIEKQLLGLPDAYPYEIYIQSAGQLNQKTFYFKYGFYDFAPNGNRFDTKRKGAIVDVEGIEYLLSANQYLICNSLDIFNSLPESDRSFQYNLKSFADIKALSDDTAVLLDSYLSSQSVHFPDKIKIDLNFENGILEVVPAIDIANKEGFVKAVDMFGTAKYIYNISDANRNTTRVVIEEQQRQELQKIKTKRRISSKEEIEEIIEHPEYFFDDELVDLSVFYGERVKEIGVYRPKFYPFVCPYKSEWIPGIVVKDKIDGEKKITFKTPVELAEFETEVFEARNIGKESFEWKGNAIPLQEAERFVRVAKEQFKNPKEPYQNDDPLNPGGNSPNGRVLIIKENAEFLEYAENSSHLEEIDHRFYGVHNLITSIHLKDHQKEGVAWLQSLYKENYRGCLLADDMGLGKTIQLLYFIEWHSQNYHHSKPYLVVAPVSLLENWENEYSKFFSPRNLHINLLYGQTSLSKRFKKEDIDSLQKKQIIFTNYETLRTYQLNICAVDYSLVVLDEAQKIKTPGTLITNVSKALKADFKIAMTGTPVENTLLDLWCIMDFSVPGLLGNAKDFSKQYQNPLKQPGVDVNELGEKLRNEIGFFIKRRLKRDVAKELPEKKTVIITKEMPLEQLQRYKAELELAQNADLEGVERRNQILKSLWAIRDISDHPYLINSQTQAYSSKELTSASAKLQILSDILTDVKSKGEKVIVFADRKETQKMLQKVVFEVFEVLASIINGDTPSTKRGEKNVKLSRQQTIDRFQAGNGFNVIIMSQLAAGVGLNVTQANHVVHYTRHWNPAKEEQATDRAYRIGQQKDVYVYYPMAVFPNDMVSEDGKKQESFDEILNTLLNRKKALATSTLFPTDQAELRPDEIFGDVFGVRGEKDLVPLTIEQVDKLNPNLFEAFIAALYAKQGYDVFLTPYANDKGADVVALKRGESVLIQAKQSKSSVGNSAVQEVFTAKKYYEERFGENLIPLVFTNSDFGQSAEILSLSSKVILKRRSDLIQMIKDSKVSIQDLNVLEFQRIKRI